MAKGMMDIYDGVEEINFTDIRWLVDSTAMAGVLMINCILVPLNVFTIMVHDRSDSRFDSFLVSSVSRGKLVFGYWLAPFLAGIVSALVGFITGVFLPIGVFNGDMLSPCREHTAVCCR